MNSISPSASISLGDAGGGRASGAASADFLSQDAVVLSQIDYARQPR